MLICIPHAENHLQIFSKHCAFFFLLHFVIIPFSRIILHCCAPNPNDALHIDIMPTNCSHSISRKWHTKCVLFRIGSVEGLKLLALPGIDTFQDFLQCCLYTQKTLLTWHLLKRRVGPCQGFCVCEQYWYQPRTVYLSGKVSISAPYSLGIISAKLGLL